MSEFIQLHLLVSYPPSNLNRDDLGRPKTAFVGGKQRLRISSQSLKRAWRTSDLFASHVNDHIGIRTRELGAYIQRSLENGYSLSDLIQGKETPVRTPVTSADAVKYASRFMQVIKGGKQKKEESGTDKKADSTDLIKIDQLTHFAPDEITKIDAVLESVASGKKVADDDYMFFSSSQSAVDIAMFGRMLASIPQYNMEAAVQVAHAFTVNQVAIEDDYFTAVDDLNRGEEDMGAGHLGEVEFGSGVFYLYLCINRSLLLENLNNDQDLVSSSLRGLVETCAKVGPSGKQSTFASRAYASYILAEKGSQQPRSLSDAFLKPVSGDDMLAESILRLKERRENIEKVYGLCADMWEEINTLNGEGSLDYLTSFVADPHV